MMDLEYIKRRFPILSKPYPSKEEANYLIRLFEKYISKKERRYLEEILDFVISKDSYVVSLNLGIIDSYMYEKKIRSFPFWEFSRAEHNYYLNRYLERHENELHYGLWNFLTSWLCYLLQEEKDGYNLIEWSRIVRLKHYNTGESLLHFACDYKLQELNVSEAFTLRFVRCLLKNGIDVNGLNSGLYTPLCLAVYNDENSDLAEKICRILILEYGAHLDAAASFTGRSMYPYLLEKYCWVDKILPLQCLSSRVIIQLLPYRALDVLPPLLVKFVESHF